MCPLRIFELAVVALVTLAGRVAAYSNQWAVHIEGGPEVAQQVAQEHGFQYLDKSCDPCIPEYQSSVFHCHPAQSNHEI